MASAILNSLILLFSVVCGLTRAHDGAYVPVLMWGATANGVSKANALARTNTEEFRRILAHHLDSEPFTVVFIENNLSYEDLTTKTDDGESIFPGLKSRNKDGSLRFYPFVRPILDSLDAITDPDRVDKVKFTADGLSAEIQPVDGNFLYVSMEDVRDGESRAEMLQRHDEFMSELFEKLKTKHDSVLAIYTARNPSWAQPEIVAIDEDDYSVRSRRSLLQSQSANEAMFFNGSSLVLLYATKITLKQADEAEPEELTGATTATGTLVSDKEVTMTIPFTRHNVVFSFQEKAGYWYLSSVNVSVGTATETLSSRRIFAEDGFSYHCSDTMSLSGDNNTLTLYDFQVQAFFGTSKVPQRFSAARDCVGFTSIPIWSGLFVVFILLTITFIGITMMMDIRTMDRFDDPKGKTITINTGE